MMRYLIIFIFFTATATAQQNTFFRTFGAQNSDFGNNLIRTADNRFALTLSGPTNPPLNSRVNIGLVKLDEIGHIEWRREYIMDSSCYAHDLIQTPDNGYLMGGWIRFGTYNAPLNAMLLKTNNAGGWQWAYQYTLSPADRIVDVLALNDGYIFTAIKNDNVWIETGILCKTDLNGNVLWVREITFQGSQFQGELLPLSSAVMSNGDIIVCSTVSENSFLDIILTKFTSAGNYAWTRRFHTQYDDNPTAMKINALDEIYVCGNSYFVGSEYDMFIFKTDTQGRLQNQMFFDAGTQSGEVARDFDFAGGRLIVTGDLGGFDQRDGFLALINVNATIKWANKYPIAPTYTNYPLEVISIPNDGYAFTGDFHTTFASREGVIVKTDNDGDAGCYTQPLQLTTIGHTFDTSTVNLVRSIPTVTRTAITSIGTVTDITEKEVCEFIHPVAQFDTSGMEANCPQYCYDFHDTTKYEPLQWHWTFDGGTPPSSTDQHPQNICFSSSGPHLITLVATNSHTSDTLTKLLQVSLQCPVTVPNVFTPDGDGVNDVFELGGLPANFTLTIYNRWGFRVFETSDGSVMWNGKYENKGAIVPEGVYFYVLSAESISEPQSGFLHVF